MDSVCAEEQKISRIHAIVKPKTEMQPPRRAEPTNQDKLESETETDQSGIILPLIKMDSISAQEQKILQAFDIVKPKMEMQPPRRAELTNKDILSDSAVLNAGDKLESE